MTFCGLTCTVQETDVELKFSHAREWREVQACSHGEMGGLGLLFSTLMLQSQEDGSKTISKHKKFTALNIRMEMASCRHFRIITYLIEIHNSTRFSMAEKLVFCVHFIPDRVAVFN